MIKVNQEGADFSWTKEMHDKLQQGMRDDQIVKLADELHDAGQKPFAAMSFAKTDRQHYTGEVGRKGDDYLFHIYPRDGLPDFGDLLGDAFLEVFRDKGRLFADFTPEMGSWVVRAVGFAANPLADGLSTQVFDVLDQKLG